MTTDNERDAVYLKDVVRALDPSLAEAVDERLIIVAREPGGTVVLDDVVNALRAFGPLDALGFAKLMSSGAWGARFPYDIQLPGVPDDIDMGSFAELRAENAALRERLWGKDGPPELTIEVIEALVARLEAEDRADE